MSETFRLQTDECPSCSQQSLGLHLMNDMLVLGCEKEKKVLGTCPVSSLVFTPWESVNAKEPDACVSSENPDPS